MNRLLTSRRVDFILRLIVGGVFVYAGILKLRAPLGFADSLAAFQLLPDSWINLVALGLPPFEIIAGTLLVTGWHLRASAFAVTVLLTVFAVALASALARGIVVDCGCFGSGSPSVLKTWLSLGRDLVLGIVAGWLYCRCLKASRIETTLGADSANSFP